MYCNVLVTKPFDHTFTYKLKPDQLVTKGSIVLVASIASYMAIRSQMSSAYCGTKGAVRAMCPGIAKELVEYVRFPHGKVLTICTYVSIRESE